MKIKFIIKENMTDIVKFVHKVGHTPLFVHFSDSQEWGSITKTWTGYKYNNPAGIYVYAFNPHGLKFTDEQFPFGSDRKYIHFFTINPNHKGQILSIGEIKSEEKTQFGFPNYQVEDWERDKEKIIIWDRENIYSGKIRLPSQFNPEKHKVKRSIEIFEKESKLKEPIGYLWNVTRNLTNDAKEWASLLRWLGYDGFVDHGTGLIHENEPSQCLFLGNHVLNHLSSFKNPNPTSSDEKKFVEKTIALNKNWKLNLEISGYQVDTGGHIGEAYNVKILLLDGKVGAFLCTMKIQWSNYELNFEEYFSFEKLSTKYAPSIASVIGREEIQTNQKFTELKSAFYDSQKYIKKYIGDVTNFGVGDLDSVMEKFVDKFRKKIEENILIHFNNDFDEDD